MKSSQKIITASAIFLLLLSGCSNKTTQQSTSQRQTTTSSTKNFDNSWHKGVPSRYQGYYGRHLDAMGEKNMFEPFYFLDNKMEFGIGDMNILGNLSYQQIDENAYIIKGDGQKYMAGKTYYSKIVFKDRQGKVSLGIYNDDNIDHEKYS